MRPRSLLFYGLLTLLAPPVSVEAQEAGVRNPSAHAGDVGPTPAAVIRGGIESAAHGPVRALEAGEVATVRELAGTGLLVVPQSRTKRGTTYMIAGGAAFIGGLIIGGDVGTAIAVGGLGLGIYGLVLYR